MIDDYARAFLPKFTGPLTSFYKKVGLTPNQISLIALGISIASAFIVSLGWLIPALILWWLGRILDGTDGIYARESGQATPFGAYLDIVCDMAAYSVMIVGFYYYRSDLAGYWFTILFFYVLCIASALSLGSLEREHGVTPRDNRGLRLGAGLAEAGETGVAYTLFLLFPAYLDLLVWAWIVVLAVTVVSRTLLARDTLRNSEAG